MFASRVFFSTAHVTDPADHTAYNEWHQLDHRPENLALDSVRHGERWVLPPGDDDGRIITDELAPFHYLNMYWLREPADTSVAEWSLLGERSFQWGRRADLHVATRPMVGMFIPTMSYVHPRVRVSPEALIYRPTRGIAVSITKVLEPASVDTESMFGWYDRTYYPALLDCDGIAGIWTFSSIFTTFAAPNPASTRFVQRETSDAGQYRVALCYLDDDPAVFARSRAALESLQSDRRARTAGIEVPVFEGLLQTIIPWQWSWFDNQ